MTRALGSTARVVAAVAALLLVAGAAPPVHAQAPKPATPSGKPKPLALSLSPAAKADFDAAKLLANDGDFAGALIKFEAAYDASKDARVLWNVAFCQKNLRRYSKVVITLKRYLDEGGALLAAGDRKDAQDLISMIEPFTTRATFKVSQDGAQVVVDEETVGTSPLPAAPILDIGERKIRITKEGFRPYERALVVAGGAEVTIDVVLEKEVHEGKLIVEAQAGATVYLDDAPIGSGRVEQVVASGGHQLRVVAPGMRPYQTEVIVQDKETRSMAVALEVLAAGEKPIIRVAVGCDDAQPRAPEDGLVVNDGADVLPPGPVRKRWSDQASANVVQHVEYAATPGKHSLRISTNDCKPDSVDVIVDPTKGADVSGALESSRFILFQGPQGSPGGLRASAGMWLGSADLQDTSPAEYKSKGATLLGAQAEVGLVGRWVGWYIQGGIGGGNMTIQNPSPTSHVALPNPGSTSLEWLSTRLGFRIPSNRVALGFGGLLGVEELDVTGVRTGKPAGIVGSYGELDVQPLCDWGIYALAEVAKPTNEDDVSVTVGFGAFFEPNDRCRREQATKYGLRPEAK
jgi:hypothetical protein